MHCAGSLKFIMTPNFELLDPGELCKLLRSFYAEVRRQDNSAYSASSMRCMRAAIQRHLKSACFNRTFNIMSDPIFNSANKVYTGKLKLIKREGGRPPKHKSSIAEGDLRKMIESDALEPSNPIGLQRLMFVYIALHFCRRGREGVHELTKCSFSFKQDDQGLEYVTMAHLESTKNNPGDLVNDPDNNNERWMHATGRISAP